MKHILCALMEPNEYFLRHIYEFGRKEGWQIERCGRVIPANWSGDGIISDYLELEDFAPVRNFERTPVVSRILSPRGNIRTVRGNTRQIASRIVNYFMDKGFTRFASIAPRILSEDIDGIPRDLLEAIRRELHTRNLSLELCLMKLRTDMPELADYEENREILREFFLRIPKPFALIRTSSKWLSLIYRVLADLNLRVPEEVAILCNTDDWLVTENAVVPTGEELPETPVYATPSGIVSRRSTDTLAVSDIRLAKAVSFFLQNYMNLIGVEDAAHAAGVSRMMLTRLFRQQFGKSPRRFLQEIRYNQISHLLDTTDLPLSEIARRTGYGSDMALSLAFKREFGMVPGTYRASRR